MEKTDHEHDEKISKRILTKIVHQAISSRDISRLKTLSLLYRTFPNQDEIATKPETFVDDGAI